MIAQRAVHFYAAFGCAGAMAEAPPESIALGAVPSVLLVRVADLCFGRSNGGSVHGSSSSSSQPEIRSCKAHGNRIFEYVRLSKQSCLRLRSTLSLKSRLVWLARLT